MLEIFVISAPDLIRFATALVGIAPTTGTVIEGGRVKPVLA